MLASLEVPPLTDPDLVYEPKYDGIRTLTEIVPGVSPAVRLWSRLGNEKTAQFPELVDALQRWARRLEHPIVLDGEIVALDESGEPAGFQRLQGRIHVKNPGERFGGARRDGSRPGVALIAFDLLRQGAVDLRSRPLVERRAALERVFGRTGSPVLRLSEQVRGDGRALHQRALSHGWEGLIAKRADSRYRSGKRSSDWRKLKIVHAQEFVVGGWTEPRQSRAYFGALLLGVYEDGRLVYTGHVGTGFDERELARLMGLLKPLEIKTSPFHEVPPSNERPHWVRPALVAQVRFTEWTADNILRHPVYLGLRDDKNASDVTREQTSVVPNAPEVAAHLPTASKHVAAKPPAGARQHLAGATKHPASAAKHPASGTNHPAGAAKHRAGAVKHPTDSTKHSRDSTQHPTGLTNQLRAIEDARRDAPLVLPDGDHLNVGNLHKVFWPELKWTKGDLMRYYAIAAPFILPAVEDRPLVMKRFPNGINGKAFYQQRAPEDVPKGVRVEHLASDDDVPTRLVGGNLKTLLYMAQLAAISQDPWFSRVSAADTPDFAAIDLDPMPGVTFEQILDVARWVHDELRSIGAIGFPKTSGADGLHVYIPLPAGTPYEAGMLFCQIIATVVAHKHPKVATVERSVRSRGAKVYVDYLQNIPGKTIATAYSARASEYAGVSAPLTWREVHEGIRREDFTIDTMPARLREVGDLWKALRTSKGVDLSSVERYAVEQPPERKRK